MVRESTKVSTYNRYKELKMAVKNPNSAPEWLIDACVTQGKLASLNKPEFGITKIAKNSMQAAADEVIEDGGWESLEILRIELRSNISQKVKKIKTKSDKLSDARQKIIGYKEKLMLADRQRVRLNRAYYDLMNIVQEAAPKNSKIEYLLNKHISIYGNELGLTLLKEELSDG